MYIYILYIGKVCMYKFLYIDNHYTIRCIYDWLYVYHQTKLYENRKYETHDVLAYNDINKTHPMCFELRRAIFPLQ